MRIGFFLFFQQEFPLPCPLAIHSEYGAVEGEE